MAAGFQSVSARGLNGKGATLSDEESKATRGEKPLNVDNPARGSGVEQTHEPHRGENRRGAAKVRGRNVASAWDVLVVSGRGAVRSRRGTKPQVGQLGVERPDEQVQKRRNSEEEDLRQR